MTAKQQEMERIESVRKDIYGQLFPAAARLADDILNNSKDDMVDVCGDDRAIALRGIIEAKHEIDALILDLMFPDQRRYTED